MNNTHILSQMDQINLEIIESIIPSLSPIARNILMEKLLNSFEDGYRINVTVDRGKEAVL